MNVPRFRAKKSERFIYSSPGAEHAQRDERGDDVFELPQSVQLVWYGTDQGTLRFDFSCRDTHMKVLDKRRPTWGSPHPIITRAGDGTQRVIG